jgi:hypothetical protein
VITPELEPTLADLIIQHCERRSRELYEQLDWIMAPDLAPTSVPYLVLEVLDEIDACRELHYRMTDLALDVALHEGPG